MPWEADPEGRGYTYRRPFKRELPKEVVEAATEDDAPRKRVAGDGLGKLRKGEQYTKEDA